MKKTLLKMPRPSSKRVKLGIQTIVIEVSLGLVGGLVFGEMFFS